MTNGNDKGTEVSHGLYVSRFGSGTRYQFASLTDFLRASSYALVADHVGTGGPTAMNVIFKIGPSIPPDELNIYKSIIHDPGAETHRIRRFIRNTLGSARGQAYDWLSAPLSHGVIQRVEDLLTAQDVANKVSYPFLTDDNWLFLLLNLTNGGGTLRSYLRDGIVPLLKQEQSTLFEIQPVVTSIKPYQETIDDSIALKEGV